MQATWVDIGDQRIIFRACGHICVRATQAAGTPRPLCRACDGKKEFDCFVCSIRVGDV